MTAAARRRSAPSGARTGRSRRKALAAWWQTHTATAADSLRRLWRAPLGSMMTVVVIGIALLLPLTLYLAIKNVSALGASMEDIAQISVYLRTDVNNEQAQQLADELQQRGDIGTLRVITPQQGASEFAEHSGLGDIIASLPENPLPAVLLITPASADFALVNALLQTLQNLPETELAQLDLEWIQRLNSILSLADRAATALFVILGFGVLFVVGNSIRMAIENRRAEILVVKLVGGTDAFVARPFLYSGFWFGLAGGVFAWGLLALLLNTFKGPLYQLLTLYDSDHSLQGLGPAAAAGLLAGSALLGWLGALLSVKQHLAAIEPR